jgi:hypothetical protein
MQTGGLLFCPSLESVYKARDQPRSVQGTALTGQKTRVSDPMVRIQRHPQTWIKTAANGRLMPDMHPSHSRRQAPLA